MSTPLILNIGKSTVMLNLTTHKMYSSTRKIATVYVCKSETAHVDAT